MTHETEVVNKLALDNHSPCTDDNILAIADHEDVVGVIAGGQEVVSCIEFFESGLANCS